MTKSYKSESRFVAFVRDCFSCRYHGCEIGGIGNIQVAHRIADTIDNRTTIKDYIKAKHDINLKKGEIDHIINHPMNLRTSCQKHNDSFNIGGRPEYVKKLIDMIYKKICERVGGRHEQRITYMCNM